MVRVRCNRCGRETSAGLQRCLGCGATLPVVFGDGDYDEGFVDTDDTVVAASVPWDSPDPGNLVADRRRPVEPVGAGLRRPVVPARATTAEPPAESTSELNGAEIEEVDETGDELGEIAEVDAEALPEVETFSDGAGEGSPQEGWAADHRYGPTAPVAPWEGGSHAAKPVESDGAIDPRILRAAVRSDANRGIRASAKAVAMLHRHAAKGDLRAHELLAEVAARTAGQPVTGRPTVESVPPWAPSSPPVARPPAIVSPTPSGQALPKVQEAASAIQVSPVPVVTAPVVTAPGAAAAVAQPVKGPGTPAKAPSRVAVPMVGRKVPRPVAEEKDLPPTDTWSPRKEGAGGSRRQSTLVPSTPLFDDSHRTGSEVLDVQQLQQPPDRSMDLIWWSLAIAGALVLAALLITFW